MQDTRKKSFFDSLSTFGRIMAIAVRVASIHTRACVVRVSVSGGGNFLYAHNVETQAKKTITC